MRSRAYRNPKNESKNADRERRRILESFDKEKIIDYLTNVLGMPVIDDEINFWAAVCKAICADPQATPSKRQQAEEWLHDHGMSTGPDDDNVPEIGKKLIKESTREMFGLIAESYIYGDLRIVKTCGEERDGITKLVVSFSQIGGEDPAEKDMVKIAQMLGIDMSKDVERYTNTSYDPYFRHTFYFEQVVDDVNLMAAKGTAMPA
ncbi:MAG: hypothetical protein IJ906_12345 [Oscillospiraceae bacterium]|nr:hypothetical protein [Oscillospiraceae bacterium]